jgi:hypothetical protein
MMGLMSQGNSTPARLDPPDRVHLHHLELVARQRAGLVEDLVRHLDLGLEFFMGSRLDETLCA